MLERFRNVFRKKTMYEQIVEGYKSHDIETLIKLTAELKENSEPYYYTLKSSLYGLAESRGLDPFKPFILVKHNTGFITERQQSESYQLTPDDRSIIQLFQTFTYPNTHYYCSIYGKTYTDSYRSQGVSFMFLEMGENAPRLSMVQPFYEDIDDLAGNDQQQIDKQRSYWNPM